MRILIIGNSAMGLVKFRTKLIQRLQENNEVYIAAPLDACVEEIKELSQNICEIQMNRRGTNPFQEFVLIRDYLRLINRIKPDYIITYTVKPNIYGGFWAGRKKIPYAANITGLGTAFQKEGFLKECVVFMYRIALKGAHTVFFENSYNAEVFIQNRILDKSKIHVLNGAGVDLEDFSYEDYPTNQKTEFLFVGRVMKEKGIEELLHAVEKLYDENPNVKLTILGDYEENYKPWIERLQEQGVIDYVGFVSDVRPYIGRCDCTVLPSYHEGMSNTLLESAAVGRPLITSDIPGCREAVVNGKTGYLAKVADEEDLLCQMRRFCALDNVTRKMMGQEARMHIERNFDKKAIVRDTIARMEL